MSVMRVKIGEVKFAELSVVLRTHSLGSCVSVILYDPQKKVAGMSHILLPTVRTKEKGQERSLFQSCKYADVAVPEMVRELERLGVRRRDLVAYVVGGAEMFRMSSTTLKVGQMNVASSKEQLEYFQIPIVREETGGDVGRTVEFHVETGELIIKTTEPFTPQAKRKKTTDS